MDAVIAVVAAAASDIMQMTEALHAGMRILNEEAYFEEKLQHQDVSQDGSYGERQQEHIQSGREDWSRSPRKHISMCQIVQEIFQRPWEGRRSGDAEVEGEVGRPGA